MRAAPADVPAWSQIDAYNEDILNEERDRLRETSPFTILEYIKTSIEILMNMKMEEQEELATSKADKKQKAQTSGKAGGKKAREAATESRSEALAGQSEAEVENSVLSGDDAPSEYEQMLQKYEAEVRNHIKIEQ